MEVALGDRLPLDLPLGGQPGDHRGAQPGGSAEEPLQRGHEVQAGQPVQIQQRQHRGDLGAAPTPARQDHALELHPLPAVRVDPPVIYPGTDHLHLAGYGSERAGRCGPVTHHPPVAALVDQLDVGGKAGVDLSLQRDRQQPPSALTDQLVQIGGQLGPCLLVGD